MRQAVSTRWRRRWSGSPATRVLIDHHLNPDVPADLIISEPEASSTCELVFRLVWQMGVFPTLTKQFAVPIYCGMMTDTGGFTYNSSRPEIFFIISELLTKRIDKDKIYRNVYHNYSESRIRLMGYVMYEKLVYMPEYNAAYYTLTKDEPEAFPLHQGRCRRSRQHPPADQRPAPLHLPARGYRERPRRLGQPAFSR